MSDRIAREAYVITAVAAAPGASGGTDVAVADGGTGSSTASGARTNLGLGTAATHATGDYEVAGAAAAAQSASQPVDATLTALAAANWAANAVPIGSGADALSQTTFAANTFPARSSSGNLVAKTITDFGLSLVDDAAASNARTTLGLDTAATIPSPFLPYRTGGTFYYAPQHGVESAVALVAGTLYAIPFFVPVATTFDSIGVVASGATASAACRLGIYADSGGVPAGLTLDAGQVAAATGGFKTIAISQALAAGWYWLACAMQGANGLLFLTPSGSGVTSVPSSAPGAGLISGYAQTGVAGALPSPWGATKTETARCPVVWVAPH